MPPLCVSEAEILTFRLLTERSNRYARWAMTYGVRKGDTVCLLMPNRPEYMAVWIGICRAGGTVALLNTHLVGPSLARSIDTVAPRHVIVARELLDQFRTATPHIATTAVVWSHGDGDPAFPDITQAVAEFEGAPLTGEERVEVTLDDRALFVYTSGTTGLPKAAIVSHFRLMNWAHWFAGMMDTRPRRPHV